MRIIKKSGKQLQKKIRNSGSKGFSIIEMLLAVLILLLATFLVSQSMRLAADQYRESTNRSKSQMIMSTLMDFVRAELTTASGFDEDGSTFVDGSGLIGGRCKLVTGDNTIYLESIDGNKQYYPILGDGSEKYAEELRVNAVINSPEKTKEGDNPYWKFKVAITVSDKKGRELTKGEYVIDVPREQKEDN
ncbi:hypothetical protein [Butyrivibrio sp. AC2005]|uniref:hypothetical protein n=1 Tax=Butyrivibrio sp. AC2005 TaxID=1280672 RepID=UPI00041F0BC3|nr:hypothetical protein [Butyrivibrio sp. AC2005]